MLIRTLSEKERGKNKNGGITTKKVSIKKAIEKKRFYYNEIVQFFNIKNFSIFLHKLVYEGCPSFYEEKNLYEITPKTIEELRKCVFLINFFHDFYT